MSDTAYTWCAIPVRCIRRHHHPTIVTAFRLTRKNLLLVLKQRPKRHPAGFDNSTQVRFVAGCPCLVHEHDDLLGGGIDLEDLLREAQIPYLRTNAPAATFPATATVHPGTGDSVTIWCTPDCQDPLVRVTWQQGHLAFDAEDLAQVDTYHRERAQLLNPAPRERVVGRP